MNLLRSWLPGLRSRLGLRGAAMLLCAYIWGLIGVGTFATQPVAPGAFHLLLPDGVRGTIWLGSALVAVVMAWAQGRSSIGLAVLVSMPTFFSASYIAAWVASLVDGGSPGYPTGWLSSAYYLALIGIVVVAAYIPSPPVVLMQTLDAPSESLPGAAE
jgi:hypothetical protein